MTYICLIKLMCNDGEIQIVAGSKSQAVVSDLQEMPTTTTCDCTLQSKVTELFEILGFPESPMPESNYEVVEIVKTQVDDSVLDDIKIESCEVIRNNGDREILEIMDESPEFDSESAIMESDICENEYNLTETESSSSKNVSNVDNVNPVVLEKIVNECYEKRKKGTATSFQELDNLGLLDDSSLTVTQTEFLQSIENEKPFKCGICGEVFKTNLDIRSHLKELHNGYPSRIVYACNYCGKAFKKDTIVSHFYSHKKPFKCSHCDKRFSDRGNLKHHLMYVKGFYRAICNICGFRCVTDHELKSHMVKHTTTMSHVCPLCGKLFARTSQLNRHIPTHNESRDFKCEICNKAFTTLINCRRHQQVHSMNRQRVFDCDVCDKSYYEKKHLLNHQLRIHRNEGLTH